MTLLEFKFEITEARGCPIYKKGDYFALSGVTIAFPERRKICIFPVKVIADLFSSLEGKAADSYKKELFGKEFNCGGCTGIIKFVSAKQFAGWDLPQFRMLAEFEAKKALTAKVTLLERQLKDIPLLCCLDENSLKDFVSCAKINTYPPGHTLLKVNTPGTNLFILLAGRVVLLNRQEAIVGHLGEGEVFGEMSLMFGQLTNVTVKSVELIKVLELSAQDFSHLLLKFPFIKMELARMIAKRLSKSNERTSQIVLQGVHGQLKELSSPELLQMIHENRKNGTVEFTLPAGKASVDFVDGEIIDAQYNDTIGKEAFYRLIMEQDGSFTFNNITVETAERPKPIGGFMSLLMEGLRLLDEKRSTTT
jgi:CRP-like cAMP-binding protein